jgi:hypothetical protein
MRKNYFFIALNDVTYKLVYERRKRASSSRKINKNYKTSLLRIQKKRQQQ